MTDDLATWLKTQLDETEFSDWHERTCQTHQKMPPGSPLGLGGSPLSCNCRVPEFVLRDVQAGRKIIEAYDRAAAEEREKSQALVTALKAGDLRDIPQRQEAHRDALGRQRGLEQAVRLLALPYADRPGYRESWRP